MSIERAWALAKPALDPNTRRLLTAASTLPGRTHDADLLRRIVGEPPWFDDAAATLAALALLTFNSPRLRVPDGVRVLVRDEAGTLADDIADRSVDVLLMAASERALDPDFVTDELGACSARSTTPSGTAGSTTRSTWAVPSPPSSSSTACGTRG